MKRKATEGGRRAELNLKIISLFSSIRERWLLFHDTVVGEKDVGRKRLGFFKEVGEGLGSEGVE